MDDPRDDGICMGLKMDCQLKYGWQKLEDIRRFMLHECYKTHNKKALRESKSSQYFL
jgi:hypothetical protein